MNNQLLIGPLHFFLFMVGCFVVVALYAWIVVRADEKVTNNEKKEHEDFCKQLDDAWLNHGTTWQDQMR